MRLTGDKTSQIYPLPFSSFPRSIPKMHISTIDFLHLNNMRLRCRADLIRFVRELPTLHICELCQVLFLDSTSLPLRLFEHINARGRPDSWVSICECGNSLPSSQLSFAAVIFPNRTMMPDHPDWNIVSDAILFFSLPNYTNVDFQVTNDGKCTSQVISLNSSENLACDISSTICGPSPTSAGRRA